MISVIIPAYNSEKFLEDCLKSIFMTDYKKFEIIIINDGSTDNTEKICKSWISKHTNIRYFYQQNRGLSHTLNKAISLSNYEYLLFCGHDDLFTSNKIYKINNLIQNDIFDFLFYGYYRLIGGKRTPIDDIKNAVLTNKREIIGSLIKPMVQNKIFSAVWRGIYKKTIIQDNNLLFIPNNGSEDLCFNIEYLFHCKKVKIIEDKLYIYRQNYNSIMNSYSQFYYQTRKKTLNDIDNILTSVNFYNKDIKDYMYKQRKLLIFSAINSEFNPNNTSSNKNFMRKIKYLINNEEYKNNFNFNFIKKNTGIVNAFFHLLLFKKMFFVAYLIRALKRIFYINSKKLAE